MVGISGYGYAGGMVKAKGVGGNPHSASNKGQQLHIESSGRVGNREILGGIRSESVQLQVEPGADMLPMRGCRH